MRDGNRYFFRVGVVEDVSCVDFESRAYGNAVIGYEYYAVFKRYAVADGVVAESYYVKRERRKRRRRTRFDFGYLFGKTFGGRRGISFEESTLPSDLVIQQSPSQPAVGTAVPLVVPSVYEIYTRLFLLACIM